MLWRNNARENTRERFTFSQEKASASYPQEVLLAIKQLT